MIANRAKRTILTYFSSVAPGAATATRQSGMTMAKARQKAATFIELARRQQIIDVALELFERNGFHETSLAEIAEEIGISKGVISYHFNGKSDLGQEVIRHIVRKLSMSVAERVEARETGREKLLEFVNACLDNIDRNRSSYLIYIDTLGCFGTMGEKRDMIAWANSNTRKIIVGLLKDGQKDGSIGKVDNKNVADVIQSIVDGLMSAIAAEPDVVNLKGCKRVVLKLIEDLIAP